MKTIMALASLLFTFGSYANENIHCTSPADHGLSYVLNSVDYEHYNLKVAKRILVPQSCRSRWGCDYEESVVYTDKLNHQGAMVFESKRTYINMEDFERVHFSYTVRGLNGKFEQQSVTLECNH